MRITKLQHATLLVEVSGARLLVDPGAWTDPLPPAELEGVVALVITHEHADHWSADHVARVLEAAPDAVVLAPSSLVPLVGELGGALRVVAPQDQVEVGPFSLRFTGGWHAAIHRTVPRVHNVGVVVNETLYHPGDSLDPAGSRVPVVAAPVGGPWLKLGETMDFLASSAPEHAFAIHELTLSQRGQSSARSRLRAMTESSGGTFHDLEPGDSFEV